jgi:copper(I)-binding protein
MDILVRLRVPPAVAWGLALALLSSDAAAIFIVTEPWVRLAPNARSAEAYMELRSTEGARLVAVSTAVATGVVLLAPVATRSAVPEIPLAANATVKLAPGAFRIALAHLDRPLKLGDRVALVLTIETADGDRQEIPVNAEVRRHSPTDDHSRAHKH